MKRSPINKRRPGPPRRGRVIARDFMRYVRSRGCLLASKHACRGPVTFHHIRKFGGSKDDSHGIALCLNGHLQGFSLQSIEAMGKEKFQAHWGVDIESEALKNREAWETR